MINRRSRLPWPNRAVKIRMLAPGWGVPRVWAFRSSHCTSGASSRQGGMGTPCPRSVGVWNWVCIWSSLIWFFRSQCSRQSSLLMYISHARFRSPLVGQSSMETPPMISEMECDWFPVMPGWSGVPDNWQAWHWQHPVFVGYDYANVIVNSCLPKRSREWGILSNGKFWFIWLSSIWFTASWFPNK